jgi:DNA-binding IclR family transcriptional regulator
MGLSDTPNRTVNTADTVFGIIEHLERADGTTVEEVAEELDIAESTAHTYLATLLDHEYAVKKGTTYYLSLRPLDSGIGVRENMDLTHAARPVIDDIAGGTDESVWIVTEEHGRGVYLMRSAGENAVRTRGRVGKRTTMHDMAAGKAILAHLPESKVEAIVDQFGLPERTGNTITDRAELGEELAEIRDRGYATNRGETIGKVWAVASPILRGGEVRGAVGIAGPKHRLNGEQFREELPDLVLEAADTIELELTYRSGDR